MIPQSVKFGMGFLSKDEIILQPFFNFHNSPHLFAIISVIKLCLIINSNELVRKAR